MITLEHVRLLESRVEKALECIERLRSENSELKGSLSSYEKRIFDLESLVQDFQTDQGRIEEGIIHALEKLNTFEESILSAEEDERILHAQVKVKSHHTSNPEVGHGAHVEVKETIITKVEANTDHALNPAYWEDEAPTAETEKEELADTVLNVKADESLNVSEEIVSENEESNSEETPEDNSHSSIEEDPEESEASAEINSDIASGELDIF